MFIWTITAKICITELIYRYLQAAVEELYKTKYSQVWMSCLKSKGLILLLVDIVSYKHSQRSTIIKHMWEETLNIFIKDNTWKHTIHYCSITARLQVLQCKIINRLHYLKAKLNIFFPKISPSCARSPITGNTRRTQGRPGNYIEHTGGSSKEWLRMRYLSTGRLNVKQKTWANRLQGWGERIKQTGEKEKHRKWHRGWEYTQGIRK